MEEFLYYAIPVVLVIAIIAAIIICIYWTEEPDPLETVFVQVDGYNYLVFDKTTNIVYVKNYYDRKNSFCPYYAENGNPYRYNEQTKTLEMIE